MKTMHEVIETVSEKLGVSETVARNGVKVILKFAQKQIPEADFAKLVDKLPGTSELLAEVSTASAAPSGMLGGLAAMLGGQAGAAAQALSELQAAGIETSQIAPFMQFFVGKAREIAGPEAVDGILKEIPILQGFLKTS